MWTAARYSISANVFPVKRFTNGVGNRAVETKMLVGIHPASIRDVWRGDLVAHPFPYNISETLSIIVPSLPMLPLDLPCQQTHDRYHQPDRHAGPSSQPQRRRRSFTRAPAHVEILGA